MLASHLSALGGEYLLEDPTIKTCIRAFAYDQDEVSAYPSATSCLNVGKSTTKRELINIEGIDETLFRRQNLNLVLGDTNSIEYSTQMFNFPRPVELLSAFKQSLSS